MSVKSPAAPKVSRADLCARCDQLGLKYTSKTTMAVLATNIEIEEKRLAELAKPAVTAKRSERDEGKRRRRQQRKARRLQLSAQAQAERHARGETRRANG